MYEELLQWAVKSPLKQKGVIVGCSKDHEWMLPWWWMHYCIHNEFPVTFFDFGDMSPLGKEWCQRKGQLLTLRIPTESFIAKREEVPSEQNLIWESHHNLDIHLARQSWFKKPFACLQTPYERTLWIDLDCQVRGSIAPIFMCSDFSGEIAMVEEPPPILENHRNSKLIHPEEMEYNGGVIAFKHGAVLVQEWAKMCIEHNRVLRGDQEAFSRMIYQRGIKITPMHPSYNWRAHLPYSSPAVIVHFPGNCKIFIRDQINMFSKYAAMDLRLVGGETTSS